jgi:hypothetical protein
MTRFYGDAGECHKALEFNEMAAGRFNVLLPGSFRSGIGKVRKSTISRALCGKSAIVAVNHRITS